jgi:pyruvate/2-oxoglutarate dehydrogenase complex dihydrolipoamide dehydrogenase (E3) component
MTETFDVVVIGGGSSGENAGGRAAAAGLSVALIESDLVGGECSYWACMPSKALLRPGEALAAARRVPGARQAVTGDLDTAAALQRRDALASGWDDRWQVQWVENAGMTFIRGHGRLAGERRVEVTTPDGALRRLEVRRGVVLAVGTRAAIPPVEGLRDIRVWDNRDITSAKEVPERLLILGGGVVGVEMAQAWRWLGAREVTVVEMQDRLLPSEEPFAAEELAGAFEELGIVVRTGARMEAVHRTGGGLVTATLDDGSVLTADKLLVAVGRRPSTEDVGLETVGLEPGSYVKVDDQLRATGVPGGWLYAVGDVNGRALLTHMGKYQARLAGDHLAGKDVEAWADHHAVPRVIFTDPQVAAVGLTEAQAGERGLRVRTVRSGTGSVAGAATQGEGISGTSQLVIDEDRRIVIGATFTGPGVAELLHAATIAITGKVSLDVLWHAVPSFPTISEVWLRLLEEYGL